MLAEDIAATAGVIIAGASIGLSAYTGKVGGGFLPNTQLLFLTLSYHMMGKLLLIHVMIVVSYSNFNYNTLQVKIFPCVYQGTLSTMQWVVLL